MKMKEFLGITDDSWHYYKNQDTDSQAKTRLKIKHDYGVLINAGKDPERSVDMLCRKWLCDKSVVIDSILSTPIVTP